MKLPGTEPLRRYLKRRHISLRVGYLETTVYEGGCDRCGVSVTGQGSVMIGDYEIRRRLLLAAFDMTLNETTDILCLACFKALTADEVAARCLVRVLRPTEE